MKKKKHKTEKIIGYLSIEDLKNPLAKPNYFPKYNKETIKAMKEAKRIAKSKKYKSYKSIEELNKALNED